MYSMYGQPLLSNIVTSRKTTSSLKRHSYRKPHQIILVERGCELTVTASYELFKKSFMKVFAVQSKWVLLSSFIHSIVTCKCCQTASNSWWYSKVSKHSRWDNLISVINLGHKMQLFFSWTSNTKFIAKVTFGYCLSYKGNIYWEEIADDHQQLTVRIGSGKERRSCKLQWPGFNLIWGVCSPLSMNKDYKLERRVYAWKNSIDFQSLTWLFPD